MLYEFYDAQRVALAGASAWSNAVSTLLAPPFNSAGIGEMQHQWASALDVFSHATQAYGKPKFNLPTTLVKGKSCAVSEHVVHSTPFGNLLHFARDGAKPAPKLMIVAPMSGHYATLLRGTVEAMLPHFDVYVTDWADAKLVPLTDGIFDLDDYIDTVIKFFEVLGPGAHAMAVCQPSVPVFAATALMNAMDHPCAPASLTMMGGPIDTREAPTSVNTLAMERPFAWFEQNVVMKVPAYYPGALRKVYPGFLQLSGFLGMNLGNHMISHWNMFKHLVRGDGESADSSKAFYEEYRSVCDMTGEFYLQTIQRVFQEHHLPKGIFEHRGTRVDASKINKTAILCIEGERDDISGIGQTKAALTLATKLADSKKQYYLAQGVGHYGIFNGRKWRDMIAPEVVKFIDQHKAQG
jgi:poly(3-hydroxybutyrate) depolymerase